MPEGVLEVFAVVTHLYRRRTHDPARHPVEVFPYGRFETVGF
ncbi:hypothetical protein CLV97_13126 [Planifilum fimeticola]|uniref:Uncharacterized protein n=1 Tax=Planifilum fimeticola TaxID=201975 RepID=A0A2T0LAW7_9BACL|nr:hypothetical protein CLV97_13126 [Planifilum fimeticola]